MHQGFDLALVLRSCTQRCEPVLDGPRTYLTDGSISPVRSDVTFQNGQIGTGRRILQALQHRLTWTLGSNLEQLLSFDETVDQGTKGWFCDRTRRRRFCVELDQQSFYRTACPSLRRVLCRTQRQLLQTPRSTTVFPVTKLPRWRSSLALDFPQTTELIAFPRELKRDDFLSQLNAA